MPVLRVTIGVTILVLGALLVLSQLGINVTPLIAGFSVLGLAVSFGSQSLVRDIVSGMFFLAEDSFRVGEYIDGTKVKGTVEGFSVRSIRLRHQNGQLHIVPFGQLTHITNFSRDWTTVKFNLAFALEHRRRAAAQDGQEDRPRHDEGAAVPEGAAAAAQDAGPGRHQGRSLIVRFKFTARPKNPSMIQRMAIRRMYEQLPRSASSFAMPRHAPALRAAAPALPLRRHPAAAPPKALIIRRKHHGKAQARQVGHRIRPHRLRRQRVRLDGRRGDLAHAARRLRRCRLLLHRHRRRLFALGARSQGRRVGGDHRQLAEEEPGQARQGPARHQVRHGAGRGCAEARPIKKSVDESLKRLNTDRVELFQSHKDDKATPLEETLSTYGELIKAGKIGAIGASNYDAPRLAEAAKIRRTRACRATRACSRTTI
jgi:hypothetical protein